MRVQITLPVEATGRLVETALEGLAGLATEQHRMMGGLPLLYTSGVRYSREAKGSEVWKLPSEVLAGGEADCEDLAAYRVAELRSSGVDPAAKIIVIRTGPRTLHAVVRRGDGGIEDPSRALGMEGIDGVALPTMHVGAERGHSWVEVSRRGLRGPIISAPSVSEACASSSMAGDEIGFIDTLLKAAGGAVDAVVPGLLPPGLTGRAMANPAQFLRQHPDVAMQAQGVAMDSGMGAEDVLRIASQLSRIIAQERRRRPDGDRRGRW